MDGVGVDLKRYPIHNAGSPAYQVLVEQCRQQLDKQGYVHLEGFLKDEATRELAAEAASLAKTDGRFFKSTESHNIYLEDEIEKEKISSTDPGCIKSDRNIRKHVFASSKTLVAASDVRQDSLISRLYAWDALANFLKQVLRQVQPTLGACAHIPVRTGPKNSCNSWIFIGGLSLC